MKKNYRFVCRLKTIIVVCMLSLLSGTAYSQTQTITGTVTEENGTPLIGINVLIKGTTTGTTTDFDGNYELKANVGDILVFSYIGFTPKEVSVGPQTQINLTLREETADLDAVVVIGYQTQRKSQISGSITQITNDVIERQSFGNFAESLQGQIAGVNVQAQSGAPGARVNVQIRGANSLSSTGVSGLDPFASEINPEQNALGPLYIIDGVAFPEPPSISPSEIESVQVLKDGASAAIYGTRASAGVIIITTIKPKAGALKVNFSTFTSVNKLRNRISTLTGPETIATDILRVENSNQSYTSNGIIRRNPSALENDTDWQDLIFRNDALTTNYNLRFTGGSDAINFSMIADHFNQQGVLNNSGFKRTNIRFNSVFNKDRFKLFSNLFISRFDSDREPYNLLLDAIRASPTEEGPSRLGPNNELSGNSTQFNFLGNILRKLQETNTNTGTTTGGALQFSYKLWPSLTARVNVSASRLDTRSVYFQPPIRYLNDQTGEILPNRELDALGSLQNGSTVFQQTAVEGILEFRKLIGNHNVSLLGGYSVENRLWKSGSTRVSGFRNLSLPTIDQATDKDNIFVSGQETPSALIGALGTLGYDYKGRYLLRANVRYDGSSKFPKQNRYAPFWGVSAAWALTKEKFFSFALPVINDLKFRASHGEVGNQNIGAFQFTPVVTNGLNVPLGPDGQIVTGGTQVRIFNDDLRWETSISDNYGIDIGLFENRFSLTGEYYKIRKEDLLFDVVLPASSGVEGLDGPPTIATNIGELTNEGAEITMRAKNLYGKFKWSMALTGTLNINQIVRLNGKTSQIPGQRITPGDNALTALPVNFAREGFEAGAFFLVETDGIIRTQEELDQYQTLGGVIPADAQIGDVRLVDSDGDNIIDLDNDRTYQGNNAPDYEIGANILLTYKNFDFNMSWFGSFGSKILNGPNAFAYANRNHKDLLYSYTPNNPTSDIPIFREGANESNYSPVTDRFLEDGDYVRLRNVQLGYNFSRKTISAIGLSNLRLYLAASNLLTITNYSGLDPEVGGDGLFSRGIDRGLTPITGSGRFGIEIEF